MKTRYLLPLLLFCAGLTPLPCQALISVGHLSPPEAKELGITMKHRKNGDAGIKVWLEFKREGFMEKLTYCELRTNDSEGKHQISARLDSHPVRWKQEKDLVSYSFSAEADTLAHCAFFIVAYGSPRGDVGYLLHVNKFIELPPSGQDH